MLETHSLDSQLKTRIHRIKLKSEKLFMAWRKFFKAGFRRSRKSHSQCACDPNSKTCNCNSKSDQLDKCERDESDDHAFNFARDTTPMTTTVSRNDNNTANTSHSNDTSSNQLPSRSSSGSSVAESKLLPISELMAQERDPDSFNRGVEKEIVAEQMNKSKEKVDKSDYPSVIPDNSCFLIPPPSRDHESSELVESGLPCIRPSLDQDRIPAERETVETFAESDRSKNIFRLAGAVALAEFSASRAISDSRHALADDPFVNRERPISDQQEASSFPHTSSSCYFFAKSPRHVEKDLPSPVQNVALDENANDQIFFYRQSKTVRPEAHLIDNSESLKERNSGDKLPNGGSEHSLKLTSESKRLIYNGSTRLSLEAFEEAEKNITPPSTDSRSAPPDDHSRFIESIVSLKAFEPHKLSLDLTLNLDDQADACKNKGSGRQSQDIISTKSKGSGKIMSSIRKAFNSSHHSGHPDIEEQPKEIQHELPPLKLESSFSLGPSFSLI